MRETNGTGRRTMERMPRRLLASEPCVISIRYTPKIASCRGNRRRLRREARRRIIIIDGRSVQRIN